MGGERGGILSCAQAFGNYSWRGVGDQRGHQRWDLGQLHANQVLTEQVVLIWHPKRTFNTREVFQGQMGVFHKGNQKSIPIGKLKPWRLTKSMHARCSSPLSARGTQEAHARMVFSGGNSHSTGPTMLSRKVHAPPTVQRTKKPKARTAARHVVGWLRRQRRTAAWLSAAHTSTARPTATISALSRVCSGRQYLQDKGTNFIQQTEQGTCGLSTPTPGRHSLNSVC